MAAPGAPLEVVSVVDVAAGAVPAPDVVASALEAEQRRQCERSARRETARRSQTALRAGLRRAWRRLRRRMGAWVSRYYFGAHLAWFTAVTLAAAGVVCGIERGRVAYVDALFLEVSAISATGLSTIDFSTLRAGSQVTTYVMVVFGGAVFDALLLLSLRRLLWRKPEELSLNRHTPSHTPSAPTPQCVALEELAPEVKDDAGTGTLAQLSPTFPASVAPLDASLSTLSLRVPSVMGSYDPPPQKLMQMKQKQQQLEERPSSLDQLTPEKISQFHALQRHGQDRRALSFLLKVLAAYWFCLWFIPFIILLIYFSAPRNKKLMQMKQKQQQLEERPSSLDQLTPEKISQFHALQRHGQDRRALSFLLKVLAAYWFCLWFIPFIILLIYFSAPRNKDVVTKNNLSVGWVAFFHPMTAFCNSGLALWSDNLMQLQRHPFVLMLLAFLIVCGNTGFPMMLRLCVMAVDWVARTFRLHKLAANTKYTLRFPRRLATCLFPARNTRLVAVIFFATVAIQLATMFGTEWNQFKEIAPGYRVFNLIFQTFSTRTAGFNSIDLSRLNYGTQVLLIIMMYMAVLPNAVTMRSTREDVTAVAEQESKPEPNGAGFQLKRLLLFDTTWVFVPFFVICLIENGNINRDPLNFTPFKILFEIASAYGTVGLTLGYPGVAYSFAGKMRPLSKLVLVLVMMMGRHRGFPDQIDLALHPACKQLAREVNLRVRHDPAMRFREVRTSFQKSVRTSFQRFRPSFTLHRASPSSASASCANTNISQ
eukprot:m51a1_g13403 putative trk1 potassium transporter (766) ;mRNA; f:23971-27425